jgi:fatty-acyl-CoA synthase
VRIEREITIAAPRERVWELAGDPRRYDSFMDGITMRGPEESDDADPAVGSRYSMRMRVGSADIGGPIELVEHDPPRDLAWTSITGIDQRGRVRVRDAGEGQSRVTLRLSYGSPGGLLGLVADRLGARQVGQHLERTLERLRAEIEGNPTNGGEDLSDGKGLLGGIAYKAGGLKVLAGTGLVRPVRPDKLAKAGLTLARWGRGPAAGFIAGAVLYENETALVDDLGTMTFGEIDRSSNRIAHSLADHGVVEGDGVAIMCRNHRGFVEATVAIAKLGANALYLNTAFAAPQLTEVVKREKPKALIYDEEFSDLLEEAGKRRKRFIAWHEGDTDDPTLEALRDAGSDEPPVPPEKTGRVIILTSGTTGTPKGANRDSPASLDPAISLLSKIPLRSRWTTHIAAPLFHSWGFAHFTLGLLLNTTMVLTRKFDPEDCLAQIERSRADVLVVVPVMMQRIMELPPETRKKYDTSSLKVVAASGSALPGDLATKWMDEFDDTLYNLYGSTEVAWATIATPADMRAAPGTAGRPPRGTILRLYDENAKPVPTGETGRIFVGNEMLFEGYTGGGGKDRIDGLMATGDVGRLDGAGRLFVEGRDDEMIVSGGENLFPQEVEDLLAKHKAVAEAACVGVPDEKFGQRLRGFVVLKDGEKVSEDELKAYVKDNLARYKVPREIWFMDELPRNATGKVLKRELKELEEAPS